MVYYEGAENAGHENVGHRNGTCSAYMLSMKCSNKIFSAHI